MKAASTDLFLGSLLSSTRYTAIILTLAGIVFFTNGCHRKPTPDKPSAPAAEPTALVPATTPLAGPPVAQKPPVNPTSQVITPDANTDVVLEKLSLELRRYVAYTRTIPKSFEEFAAHNTVQFPPAPAGKKYAIQQGKVILVTK